MQSLLYSALLQNVSLTSTQRRSQISQLKENKIGADTYLVECCYQQEFILHTLPMPQAYTRSYVFLFFSQNTLQPLITSTACHPNSPIPNTRRINLLARTNKNKHKMLLHFSYNLLKTMKSKTATSFVKTNLFNKFQTELTLILNSWKQFFLKFSSDDIQRKVDIGTNRVVSYCK